MNVWIIDIHMSVKVLQVHLMNRNRRLRSSHSIKWFYVRCQNKLTYNLMYFPGLLSLTKTIKNICVNWTQFEMKTLDKKNLN